MTRTDKRVAPAPALRFAILFAMLSVAGNTPCQVVENVELTLRGLAIRGGFGFVGFSTKHTSLG